MALDLAKVQVYEGQNGKEVLVGTNLYKMFSRRSNPKERTSPVETYIAQGGRWYDIGGGEFKLEEIPEWVWAECKAMSPIDRGMYRILLPDEIKAGQSVPSFEETPDFPPATLVMKTLLALDPANNAHWTDKGLPSVEQVSTMLGVRVSRQRITQAAPRFVRPAR